MVTWLHFHEWCRYVAEDLEIDEYSEAWSAYYSKNTRYGDELAETLNEKFPGIISQALKSDKIDSTPFTMRFWLMRHKILSRYGGRR